MSFVIFLPLPLDLTRMEIENLKPVESFIHSTTAEMNEILYRMITLRESYVLC